MKALLQDLLFAYQMSAPWLITTRCKNVVVLDYPIDDMGLPRCPGLWRQTARPFVPSTFCDEDWLNKNCEGSWRAYPSEYSTEVFFSRATDAIAYKFSAPVNPYD